MKFDYVEMLLTITIIALSFLRQIQIPLIVGA
jgi:hypothetical protein